MPNSQIQKTVDMHFDAKLRGKKQGAMASGKSIDLRTLPYEPDDTKLGA